MSLKKRSFRSLDLYPPDKDDDDPKPEVKEKHPDVDGDDEGGDNDGDGENYSQEEFISMRNELKKTKDDLAKLRAKNKKPPKQDDDTSHDVSKLETENKTLRDQIKAFEEEKEQQKLKGKDETAKELYKANKKIDELEAEISQLKSQLSEKDGKILEFSSQYQQQVVKFREGNLKLEIREAAKKYNAMNENQIVSLTKDDFIFDEDLDRWVVPILNKKGEMVDGRDVDDYIKEFMSKPENDNLVRSGKKGGSGEPPASGDTAPKSNTDKNKSSSGKVTITDKDRKEAAMNDMDPEEWVALKNERKKILEERKKNK